MRAQPPDAFVIDLSRVPSQGAAVGVWLRQQKTTRHVPLVFVGGVPEKVARVRGLLPDAVYTEWRRIRGGLKRARVRRPAAPVVPGTMDAYAGATLPQKLGVRPGQAVLLIGAPADFADRMGPLPEGVRLLRERRGQAEVVLLFARSQAGLRRAFSRTGRARGRGQALDRLAQAGLRTGHRPHPSRSQGVRAGRRIRGLQDLRDRSDLVRPLLRPALPKGLITADPDGVLDLARLCRDHPDGIRAV